MAFDNYVNSSVWFIRDVFKSVFKSVSKSVFESVFESVFKSVFKGVFESGFESVFNSALDPDVRRQWDGMPHIYTEDMSRSGEHVINDVKIWSVKAGALVFEVLYEPVRTASRPSSHVSSQPQASDGSTISSSSDTYGTFPSI
jgi:hypothetical protein